MMLTGNANKLAEFRQILGRDFPRDVTSVDLYLLEYQGKSEEVATEKWKLAAQEIKGLVVVEDTSLCFNALGGMPWPYIKWGPHAYISYWMDFRTKQRRRCVYSPTPAARPKPGYNCSSVKLAEGPANFGWDPCFQPDGFEQTCAEMSTEQKNELCDRAKAIREFKKCFTV